MPISLDIKNHQRYHVMPTALDKPMVDIRFDPLLPYNIIIDGTRKLVNVPHFR